MNHAPMLRSSGISTHSAFAVRIALLTALYDQFAHHDLPCPASYRLFN